MGPWGRFPSQRLLSMRRSSLRTLAAAGVAILTATGAQAALVGVSPNVDLSVGGPFTVSLGGGAAS